MHRDDAVPPSTFLLTVGDLFAKQVRLCPDRVAVECGGHTWTFGELDARVNRWVRLLADRGVRRGERVAVLSENRPEYLEVELAAAKLGAIAACQNWRLAPEELRHCITLVAPAVVITSARHAPALHAIDHGVAHVLTLGEELEAELMQRPARPVPVDAVPEDGLVILYTSGTTGLPKGAVISHRAMIARMAVYDAIIQGSGEHGFLAWAPMFHMASTDHSLITLLRGGTVVVSDGLDLDVLVATVERHKLGWLMAMPGMIEQLIARLRERPVAVREIQAVGAMADLIPRHQIAELTGLLNAPFLNTFGSTEAGLAPACMGRLPIGEVPTDLRKRESPLCDVRLVVEDEDVPQGTPGELLMRGPTLFSGYWNAPEVNEREFRHGWFHTGDLFVRYPDGSLDFVDRAKYMIKTGGENVYPAEIERHLLAHPDVADAVVVRKPDPRWGEVPVAFVATHGAEPSAEEVLDGLRSRIARYKLPKEIHFVQESALPRSTTGKIQRHEVEAWLTSGLTGLGRPAPS